jgi:hypothetical protein
LEAAAEFSAPLPYKTLYFQIINASNRFGYSARRMGLTAAKRMIIYVRMCGCWTHLGRLGGRGLVLYLEGDSLLASAGLDLSVAILLVFVVGGHFGVELGSNCCWSACRQSGPETVSARYIVKWLIVK